MTARITNEERHDIAEKLRKTANEYHGGRTLRKILTEELNVAGEGNWRDVILTLADLIDYPMKDNENETEKHNG